ncbi:MAG: hypothetical protein CL441_09190 [Acidimicrobiaceae bacterium]|nr:hypothetical protein [Acidimicrobiaceae bacterium]
MHSRHRRIAPLVLATLISTPVLAQDPADDGPWSGSAEVSAVATTGNSDTRTFGLGGELTYEPGTWTWLAKAAYVETSADDQLRARSFDGTAEASRSVTDRLEVYGRGGYLRDLFAGIERRLTTEGGLAWDAIGNAPHSLQVLAGVGVTREIRLVGDDLTIGTANATGRYAWALSETSELTEEAAFVADLTSGDNWRFSNEIAVTAGLNRLLSLKVSHKLSYLNMPVPGFKQTDTISAAALVATF